MELLDRAIYNRRYAGDRVRDADVKAALDILRPYCFDMAPLNGFMKELFEVGSIGGGQAETALPGSSGSWG